MMNRRAFLELLAVAGSAGVLRASIGAAEASANLMLDPPRFGNLSLLQIGDTHGQLTPAYYREPAVHLGLGQEADSPPYLTGEYLLEHYRVMPGSLQAHALTHLNFAGLAEVYGKSGGYAHLATVIKSLRASRPDSLLLDCGDSLYGSALSHWLGADDMVAATRMLGVDAITGAGEFALGRERLKEIFSRDLHGQTAFVAQVHADDAGLLTPARPYVIYFIGGVPVGVIGQAAWPSDGAKAGDISEETLRATVSEVRSRGARLVVLLSHAGLAVDMKLASRVPGIDVVLSGGGESPLPEPIVVRNGSGRTLISSVGAYGKFCGVLDLDLRNGRLRDYRFRLIPVFANLVKADPEMDALIAHYRAPFSRQLSSKLADNEMLLYRRGNFYSTTDELIMTAMREATDADIAFVPGLRSGTTLVPGEPITLECLLQQMLHSSAIQTSSLSGKDIRERLEGWLDEVFNLDPYLRSGRDMVRVAGLRYRCHPGKPKGSRISDIWVRDKLIIDTAEYRTVHWGVMTPPSPPATATTPAWTTVAEYLRRIKTVKPFVSQSPLLEGVASNRGYFDSV